VNTYINVLETLERARFAANVLGVSSLLASAIVTVGIVIQNKDRGDDGVRRRGRIGIQGNDIKKSIRKYEDMATSLTNKLDFGTGGSKVSASNDTLTWGWTRTWPLLKAEANAALGLLQSKIGWAGVSCRKTALERASAAIAAGPLFAPFDRDFQGENLPYCDGSERVDVHVFQGKAFE
jgi:hypothetical protein